MNLHCAPDLAKSRRLKSSPRKQNVLRKLEKLMRWENLFLAEIILTISRKQTRNGKTSRAERHHHKSYHANDFASIHSAKNKSRELAAQKRTKLILIYSSAKCHSNF